MFKGIFNRQTALSMDPSKFITKAEAQKLEKINKYFVGREGDDGKLGLMGALTRIGVSSESLGTLCLRLNVTQNYPSGNQQKDAVVGKMKQRDIEKSVKVATETLHLLSGFFDNTASSLKDPDPTDPLDTLLHSISSGPNRCRFFQIQDGQQLADNAGSWAEGNGPFRSLVTSLAGMSKFRDASQQEPIASCKDGFGIFVSNTNAIFNMAAIASGSEKKQLSAEDIKDLQRFEEIGKKAYALLDSPICLDGNQTTFKTWGTKADLKLEAILKSLMETIKSSGVDSVQVVGLVESLNKVIADTISLGELFEITRNKTDAAGASMSARLDNKEVERQIQRGRKSTYRSAVDQRQYQAMERSGSLEQLSDELGKEGSDEDEPILKKRSSEGPKKVALLPPSPHLGPLVPARRDKSLNKDTQLPLSQALNKKERPTFSPPPPPVPAHTEDSFFLFDGTPVDARSGPKEATPLKTPPPVPTKPTAKPAVSKPTIVTKPEASKPSASKSEATPPPVVAKTASLGKRPVPTPRSKKTNDSGASENGSQADKKP